jgi:hypothetical protein
LQQEEGANSLLYTNRVLGKSHVLEVYVAVGSGTV